MNIVWLASYPRSGSTFLRTILWQCFGLRSASIYPNDLGGNSELAKYVGHIEHGPDGKIRFQQSDLALVKTHEYPIDANPAIYVVRDGRAAAASLWRFYNGQLSLEDTVEGRHRFGTWSDHLRAWAPYERRDTLLLEYEQMRTDLPATLQEISGFLKKDIVNDTMPSRAVIANADGRWVRPRSSDWRSTLPENQLRRFEELNAAMLAKMRYLR
jgi:hypothetical protein